MDDPILALLVLGPPGVTLGVGLFVRRRARSPRARRLTSLGLLVQLVGSLLATAVFSLILLTDGSVWSRGFAYVISAATAAWLLAHAGALALHAAAWRAGRSPEEPLRSP